MNDIRQIPIIIPTEEQLSEFEKLFDEAYQIKKEQISNKIYKIESENKLEKIQSKLNSLVYKLYDIKPM